MLPGPARNRVLIQNDETPAGRNTQALQMVGRAESRLSRADHDDIGLDRQPGGELRHALLLPARLPPEIVRDHLGR